MDGVLIFDKPEGYTSHDVVARLRRILKTKRIGHTGTLDPFATGVLVMLVGRATRLAQYLDKDAKEYEAVVRFGGETDTGDRTGELRITNNELRDFSAAELENALANFRGTIEQTPPMYSAKKVAGKKLYELARQGIEIERKAVTVTIHNLEISVPPKLVKAAEITSQTAEVTHFKPETRNQKPETLESEIKVLCSAGTYIRTLAEDIGRKLETGAHLAELRRTKAGKFDLSKALTIEALETVVAENRLSDFLVSMNEAVSHLPSVILSASEVGDTKNGKRRRVENAAFDNLQSVRMIDETNNLIAVGLYNAEEKSIQPKLVLI